MRWAHALLMVAVLLAGCGDPSTTEVVRGPCDALADEMVAAVAAMTATMDSAYPGLALAGVPTDPPLPAVTRFKDEMQGIERRRRDLRCDPEQFSAAVRERAHRVRGDGYMARTYRTGLEHWTFQPPAAQDNAVDVPSTQ